MIKKTLCVLALFLAAGAALGSYLAFRGRDEPVAETPPAPAVGSPAAPSGDGSASPKGDEAESVLAAYAGSASCRECHEKEHEAWRDSHHAAAERFLDPERDRDSFDPPRTISHGTQTSTARFTDGRFEIETLGFGGKREAYPVERVFGVSPLYQFLVPAGRGRYQVTELAFDPHRAEWFDVYGDEDRRPGEWGHWTGRGMNWNSMCAGCHNTRVVKGYDEKTDAYDTRVAEIGVGCEACHGPLRDHVEWQRRHADDRLGDPGLFRLAKGHILPLCGSCHSRRAELTGQFNPGEDYLDHYRPQIPDDGDAYYPDGQVRDEDFEFVSFIGSRMHNEGVRCANCHDPHSARIKFEGNELCLQCHKGKVDPGPHSHHEPGTPGGNCVDCHMPLTTYMQRHPRRDHGFTIPDPLLTREFGIPNACNRCHEDKSVEWAIDAVERWYGQRMERHTRARTRVVAGARTGTDEALEALLLMVREEKHPFWRAVMAGLLDLWPADERARTVLLELTFDEYPLVRSMAAHALDRAVLVGDERVGRGLERLLDDPVRLVRVEAAWALRRTIDPGSRAGSDLWTMLQHNADQPTGALQLGVFNLERDLPKAALPWLERAVEWDPGSPPLRETLAVCLSILGRPRDAAHQLAEACRLAPDEPVYRYRLGLSLAEVADEYRDPSYLERAVASFEKAVKLAPDFARAWYNLALGRSKLGDPAGALAAVETAERLEPTSADFPYVRALFLKDLGRFEEARQAAERALSLDREYAPAQQLLDFLDFEG